MLWSTEGHQFQQIWELNLRLDGAALSWNCHLSHILCEVEVWLADSYPPRNMFHLAKEEVLLTWAVISFRCLCGSGNSSPKHRATWYLGSGRPWWAKAWSSGKRERAVKVFVDPNGGPWSTAREGKVTLRRGWQKSGERREVRRRNWEETMFLQIREAGDNIAIFLFALPHKSFHMHKPGCLPVSTFIWPCQKDLMEQMPAVALTHSRAHLKYHWNHWLCRAKVLPGTISDSARRCHGVTATTVSRGWKEGMGRWRTLFKPCTKTGKKRLCLLCAYTLFTTACTKKRSNYIITPTIRVSPVKDKWGSFYERDQNHCFVL